MRGLVLLFPQRVAEHKTRETEHNHEPNACLLGSMASSDAPILLSPIERHILARVAVHCHTHDGRIPFIPPNSHVARVARAMSSNERQLLVEMVAPATLRRSFRLSPRGEQAVCQQFGVVSPEESERRETEFNFMRKLMCSLWEQCA